ncbi:MAG TPA: 3-hydroxybutyryl-CoA dehydrogenase [Bacteroidales bacterium]|nr:3-hydroxybutyryl-CoA dehydrogenase [Bacteroidales bacterium]
MKNIAVIGSGTMGNGIVHVFAQNGYKVAMIDIKQEALDKAFKTIEKNLDRQIKKGKITEADKKTTIDNITAFTSIKEGVSGAELVIEAATENPKLKFDIFSEVDKLVEPNVILASNTSSISITEIASKTNRPDKVIGMHFMNPVPVMKLVEIIKGFKTSDETLKTIMETTEALHKVPVEVNDYPGFVANRILMPMINEAITTLQQGVAGVEEIDTVMMLGMAHPMGPLHLADFIGLDVCLYIMQVMYEGLGDDRYAPNPLLVKMVASGNLGVKTGSGFYVYTPGSKEKTVAPQFVK